MTKGNTRAKTGANPSIKIGLESFIESAPPWAYHQRLGLLCNPASVDSRLRHAIDLVAGRFPGQLRAVFTPQHGLFAAKQANMVESQDTTYSASDLGLELPVYSLYGQTRIPTEAMLAPIDVLLVDLQDVGTRVYTFIYTLSYCMEAAAAYGKRVVVLDRPNPLGGERIEGSLTLPEFQSFVGRYPIPMRHGLTIGEFAQLINRYFDLNCALEVYPMEGWRRDMYFDQTGLAWIAPSPNMPAFSTALVYPGQVLWEGTNMSEGRGTTLPFELFGAPFLDPQQVHHIVDNHRIPGVALRPAGFEPQADKWRDELCLGFQLHVIDRKRYEPVSASLKLLEMIYTTCRGHFAWSQPPYEYNDESLPIDLILGTDKVRWALENQIPMDELILGWQTQTKDYRQWRRPCLLYPDSV